MFTLTAWLSNRIMLSIRIICVGKLKERFYSDAVNEYAKRLAGFCKLEIVEIPENRLPAEPSDLQITNSLDKERSAIRASLPAGAFTVALCIEGQETDSHGLSALLSDCAGRGASRLCFIIGGSYGLHTSLKTTADINLSLSKMTFPHNLARIILLEQLYRAFMIIEGGKYHK